MNFPELGNVTSEASRRRPIWKQLDGWMGRGSYHRLRRWLDPEWEYNHFAYARLVSGLLKKGMRWLDAGCGHQILEFRLLNAEQALVATAGSAVGCDTSLPALQRHRSLRKVVCCSLDALPFEDGNFDLVTLNMVVEHLRYPEPVLGELARILDGNGLLIVHTPNASGYQTVLNRIWSKLLPRLWVYRIIRLLEHREPDDVFPTFYRANTRQHLRDLMNTKGLMEEHASLLEDRPLLCFFAPFWIVEVLLRRFLHICGCRELTGGTILGVYRRPTEAVASLTAVLEADQATS